MERVHKEIYEPEGKWHYGDEPVKPAGIQTLTVNGQTDIWPSWFNKDKNSGITKETLVFNRYNYLLASTCTPEAYKIQIEATKTIDPMTGKDSISVPEPYNREKSDTCDYVPPQVNLSTSGKKIIANISEGSEPIAGYVLYVDGIKKAGVTLESNGTVSGFTLAGSETEFKFEVTDKAGYTATRELKIGN